VRNFDSLVEDAKAVLWHQDVGHFGQLTCSGGEALKGRAVLVPVVHG
jgi:hypothetical protein